MLRDASAVMVIPENASPCKRFIGLPFGHCCSYVPAFYPCTAHLLVLKKRINDWYKLCISTDNLSHCALLSKLIPFNKLSACNWETRLKRPQYNETKPLWPAIVPTTGTSATYVSSALYLRSQITNEHLDMLQ
jgi:hypothetical protein